MTASNIEFLAYEETPLGPLCLRRRALLTEPGTVVTEVTLNHEFLMSSYHTASERALAEGALSLHDEGLSSADDLRVMVGGLGLGYTVQAVLESTRVARVDVIEFLPQVIDWVRDGLVPLSETLNRDPRFHPILGDVYASLARPPGAAREAPAFPAGGYDLILIDVDHSPDERLGGKNEAFYTAEGLVRARSHLADDGVLGVWSYAESSAFSQALRDVFENVRVVPVRFMNRMVEREQVDWLFFAT